MSWTRGGRWRAPEEEEQEQEEEEEENLALQPEEFKQTTGRC